MALTVETALVTKRSAEQNFNTDSLNACGKLWSNDVIHGEKGIRVAGTNKGTPYYVLASSKTKGTAQSASDLFQQCVAQFKEDGSNCAAMLSEYLNKFAKVLIESGFASSDCSFAVLAGFDDTVYVGKSGDCRAYAFSDGAFTEIKPQLTECADGKSAYGVAQCNYVKPGDLFILLPGQVADVFPAGLLKAVCAKAEGDVKKIVALINSQAAKYGCNEAVSAIVMKVTDVEAPAQAAIAEAQEEKKEEDAEDIAAAFAAAAAQTEKTAEEKQISIDDQEESNSQPVKKGKRVGIILLITLLAIALLAVLWFFVSGASEKYFGTTESTAETSSETETESESETLSQDTPESTEEASSSEEEATAESTTEEPATEETTTRRQSNNTTRAPETTEPTSSEEEASETESQSEQQEENTTIEDVSSEESSSADQGESESISEEQGGEETPSENTEESQSENNEQSTNGED